MNAMWQCANCGNRYPESVGSCPTCSAIAPELAVDEPRSKDFSLTENQNRTVMVLSLCLFLTFVFYVCERLWIKQTTGM